MSSPRQPAGRHDPTVTPPAGRGFVELDRKFAPLPKTGDREAAADDSYLFWALTGRNQFGWDKLLKKPLVVVLGEPGSGKTWELEHRAAMLSAKRESAFFIRLEDLIGQPLAVVLSQRAAEFTRWKTGTRRASFFLDSVDESKLNGAEDFYTALRHFREALPADFAARTNIFLSSRISEWHPDTDGARVREYFGVAGRQEINEEDDDGATTKRKEDDGVLVVQIRPLDRDQVAAFARAKGCNDVDGFLSALDRAHAWEFARRPIDVLALADFWQQEHRIGSLTELLEFDLGRKLRERREHSGDPLSDADARAGAEALAAAAVFCGQANIKVTDENLTGDGLEGRVCVPEIWTNDQFAALLTRPVFDGASYGRIRFHHRRVREYLAACWVGARMRAGCTTDELEALFFEHISGRLVIRASRAPVAAWLCAGGEQWNVQMRRWALEAAPNLSLRFGDPHALPLDYKQAMLAKLVAQARVRQHLWLDTDEDALSRLADPGLAADIESIIRDASLASDLRAAMLELVRHGRLAACLPAVLDLVASPAEPDDLKIYAVAALRELSDPASLARLASIANALPRAATGLTDLLIDVLFPSRCSVDELVGLLRKTCDRNGRRPDLAWQIIGHLKAALQPDHAGLLLGRLLPLVQAEPVFPSQRGELPVSQEFAWLRPVVLVVLTGLLRQRTLSPEETANASIALAAVGTLQRRHQPTGEETPKLNELTLAHPAVRRDYFWAAVRRHRTGGLPEVTHWHEVFSRHDDLLEPARADLDWLMQDLETLPTDADRTAALRLAMQFCNDLGRPWSIRRRIGRAVGDHPGLNAVLAELDRQGRLRPLQRQYYRLQHAYYRHRRHGAEFYGRLRGTVNWFRDRFYLWRNRERIVRGELFGVVCQLVNEADPESRSRWTIGEWHHLARKRGRAMAEAVRLASKRFWRTFTPLLPYENPDSSRVANGLIVGLTGLHAAWKDDELDFATLTDDEVRLATRYALNEMNGFPPWLSPLAERRPQLVGAVFAECALQEYEYPADRPRGAETLQRCAWSGAPTLAAVQVALLTKLSVADPPSVGVLNLVLTFLLNQAAPPLPALEATASARVTNAATPTGPVALWFTVWLQIDPPAALNAWETHLRARADADQVMVAVGANLQNHDGGRGPRLAETRHRNVASIRRLLPVVFTHVRPTDDLDRANGGTYTPGARDYAQEFRGGLLRHLVDSREATAADALEQLANEPALAHQRDYLLHLRDEHWTQQADRVRWRPFDVREFALQYEVPPQTDRDLFRIVVKRLGDIKRDVERSDLGLRTNLRAGDREALLRIWIAQQMIQRSRQRYTVPQEAVIDQNERPDIRVENPATDAVSVEVKWAGSWSTNELLDALENQLFGQYLRAHNSRHGVLLVGMIGDKQWWEAPDGSHLDFGQLAAFLQAKANELEQRHFELKRLVVVGIDFRDPAAP